VNRIMRKILNIFFDEYFDIYKNCLKLMLGQQAIIASRSMYTSLQHLHDAEVKVFSQWGEDGILDYLFTRLDISKPKIVEFGVGIFQECNSRFTAEFRNASVYMVDLNKDLVKKVKESQIYWMNSLFPIIDRITPDNSSKHLDSARSLMGGIDVVSLDIDGNDYWVLKPLELDSISIVVCEYNPIYGSNISCTIERNDEFDRSIAHYSGLHYGMSLRAAISLMDCKGFIFLGTNRAGNNAFFLKKELTHLVNIELPFGEDLESFVDWRVRESRNRKGELTYLSSKDLKNEIADCLVYDISEQAVIKVSHIRS